MPLFQNSVITKYLQTQNREKKFNKSKMETKDKEIDSMVYELYGLSEEEVRIVEKG
jgi:hypothetical protein